MAHNKSSDTLGIWLRENTIVLTSVLWLITTQKGAEGMMPEEVASILAAFDQSKRRFG